MKNYIIVPILSTCESAEALKNAEALMAIMIDSVDTELVVFCTPVAVQDKGESHEAS